MKNPLDTQDEGLIPDPLASPLGGPLGDTDTDSLIEPPEDTEEEEVVEEEEEQEDEYAPGWLEKEYKEWEQSDTFQAEEAEVEEEEEQEFFAIGDLFEGIGLGALGAIEGILELPTVLGLDYDIPTNFGLGTADTTVGRFAEGMTSFMVPFMAPGAGWVAGGAKIKGVGSLVSESSAIAKGAGAIRGGTFRLGNHLVSKHAPGLTKKSKDFYQKKMLEKAVASGEGNITGLMGAASLSAQAKLGGLVPEMAAAGIGGAMVDFTVWDVEDPRFSDWMRGVPLLDNTLTRWLARQEEVGGRLVDKEESVFMGKVKLALEGAGMGIIADTFISGIRSSFAYFRVKRATGSTEKALDAAKREKIQNDISYLADSEFAGSREEATHQVMLGLGINRNLIHYDGVYSKLEKEFVNERVLYQRGKAIDKAEKALDGLLTLDEIVKLNTEALNDIAQLVESDLDGSLDREMMKALALTGENVSGEFARMKNQVLPAMLPPQPATKTIKNPETGKDEVVSAFHESAQTGDVAKRIQSEDDGSLFAALNAIFSPNQDVITHTGAAMSVVSAWRAAGRPTDEDLLASLIEEATARTGTTGMGKEKEVVRTLRDYDTLDQSELLDRVAETLNKTRAFAIDFMRDSVRVTQADPRRAGGLTPLKDYYPASGPALDVHMGHAIKRAIWSFTSLYGKTAGSVEGTGAVAYRVILRQIAKGMKGFSGATNVQESAWAAITSIKGLLQIYRGNIDDVLDNMYGEATGRLWDHNLVFGDLLDNPTGGWGVEFGKLLEEGGVPPQVMSDLRGKQGVFTPKTDKFTGVREGVDREAMVRAVKRIQEWTATGTSSGTPGIVKRVMGEFFREGGGLGNASVIANRGHSATHYVNAQGKTVELNKTQKLGIQEGNEVVYYGGPEVLEGTHVPVVPGRGGSSPEKARKAYEAQGGKVAGLSTEHEAGLRGLPDTYRLRPQDKPPTKAKATKGLSDKERSTPKELKGGLYNKPLSSDSPVSVVIDGSSAVKLRTSGGGAVKSVRTNVTLKDVTFEVIQRKDLTLKGTIKGKPVKGPLVEGAKISDGIEVKFDPKSGALFEGNYAIKSASEVSIIGDRIFVRGNVKYWTVKNAMREGKGSFVSKLYADTPAYGQGTTTGGPGQLRALERDPDLFGLGVGTPKATKSNPNPKTVMPDGQSISSTVTSTNKDRPAGFRTAEEAVTGANPPRTADKVFLKLWAGLWRYKKNTKVQERTAFPGEHHFEHGAGAEFSVTGKGGRKQTKSASSDWMKENGKKAKRYDLNRTPEANDNVIDELVRNPADHGSSFNVLNTIKEKGARNLVLRQLSAGVKPGRPVYITVHNAGKAKPGISQEGAWQNSKRLSWYLEEVREVFPHAEIKNNVIIAFSRPLTADTKDTARTLVKVKNKDGGFSTFNPQLRLLYQDEGAPKGATSLAEEAGELYLRAFEGADASTHPHEMGHAWVIIGANRNVPEAERVSAQVGGLYDMEIDVLEKAVGVVDGKWTREQHETVAVWHEAFVLEGKIMRAVDDEGNELLSQRDFEILQVAMAKMSEKVQKVFHATDLAAENIPPQIKVLFNAAHQRGSVQEVMEALGDEARNAYQHIQVGAGSTIRSELQERLSRYEEKLDRVAPGWRDDDAIYQGISPGIRGQHTRIKNLITEAAERQHDVIKGVWDSYHTNKLNKELKLKETLEDLDDTYPEGWKDTDLSTKELAELTKRRKALADSEMEFEDFSSEFLSPELERALRGKPAGLNVARTVGSQEAWDDLGKMKGDRDDVQDLFSDYLADAEDQLKAGNVASNEAVAEQVDKIYENMARDSRKTAKKLMSRMDRLSEDGIKFRASVLATRRIAADLFTSAEDAKARILGAREKGVRDDIAINDFLFYSTLYKPLAYGLKRATHDAGSALKNFSASEDPYSEVVKRATTPEEAARTIANVEKQLDIAKGDKDIDGYLDRLFAAMNEGEYQFMKVANPTHKDWLDPVLEAYYNSILSGPRTHAVNILSNTIYGTLLHVERKIGGFAMRKLRGDPHYPKHVAAVVTMREMFKDAFGMAALAWREGSAQMDPKAGRVLFDEKAGVFSGTQTKDWAKALGAENMPAPFKALIQGVFKTISLNGWPTKLLGAEDEFFKQLHGRMIVLDEITQIAAKKFTDPAQAEEMADFIRHEFDTLANNGHTFTRKQLKLDGLQEAYKKGLNKADARRYAEDYVNERWTEERGALHQRALNFARKSTFTHPNNPEVGANFVSEGIQQLGAGMQEFTKSVRWLSFMNPFINTPTNLMSEASDHLLSPIFDTIAGGKAIRSRIQGTLDDIHRIGDPEELEAAMGRLAISSSLISLVWMKAHAGEITGGGPDDPAAQKILRDGGWQPYSIRFGDTYYGYGRLDPLASVFGIVADIAEACNGNPYTDDPEDEGIQAGLYAAMVAVFRNISEKSYLSGMINLASAIDKPGYYVSNWSNQLGGAIIPNLIGQASGQLDDTSREVRTYADKLKSRIPYMGGDLLPTRNFLGEKLKRIQYAGGPLLGLLNPVPHNEVTSDPIKRELLKFGEVIGAPEAKKFGTLDLRQYNEGGRNAFDRFQELQGEVTHGGRTMKDSLERLIDSSSYNRMPDFTEDGGASPKVGAMRKEVSRYRKSAWKQLLKEFPLLKENYNTTLYNRGARRTGRAERELIDLIK